MMTGLITLLLTIIVLFPSHQNSIKSSFQQCVTSSSEFWQVYKTYFEFSKYIAVSILNEPNSNQPIVEFSNLLLKKIYLDNTIHITVEIKHYIVSFYNGTTEHKLLENFQASNTTSYKWKKQSSNSFNGHLIVVSNTNILYLFLQKLKRLKIINPRTVYAILILKNKLENCFNWNNQIRTISEMLWKEFQLLQVVIASPCSCFPDTLFLYDPFQSSLNGSDGIVQEYKLFDVQNDPTLIVNSVNNLNGYSLNVSMFVRRPTAMTTLPRLLKHDPHLINMIKLTGFVGVDGSVLFTLSRYMNFNVNIIPPSDGDNFGLVSKNGKITGSLADIVNKKVDLSANSRFITEYNTGDIEFTSPIMGDAICVVVPKAARIPQWMVIFKCFSLNTWIAIFSFLVVSSIIWHFYRSQTNYKSFLEVYGLFLGHPMNLKPRPCQYLFIASLTIFNVIVIGIFQGTLMTSFSQVTYYQDINTLEDLVRSNLPIKTSLNIFSRDSTNIMKILNNRKIFAQGNSLDEVAYKRNVATLERRQDGRLFIKTNYMKDSKPLIHMVEECPSTFFVAYIVPKGSPYLNRFNYLVETFFESGLIDKWYNDITESMIVESRVRFYQSEDKHSFNLYDIQAAFYILAFGISIAILSFCCEILYNKK